MDASPSEVTATQVLLDVEFLAAASEAVAGNYVQAENLLRGTGGVSRPVRVLDLLARIAVHKGQDSEARKLWDLVLVAEPNNASAKAALARLGSPWRLRAWISRISYLAGVTAIFCLAVLGLWGLIPDGLLVLPGATLPATQPMVPVQATATVQPTATMQPTVPVQATATTQPTATAQPMATAPPTAATQPTATVEVTAMAQPTTASQPMTTAKPSATRLGTTTPVP